MKQLTPASIPSRLKEEASLLSKANQPAEKKSRFGTFKGQIWIADDFDAPLPDEILKDFLGEEESIPPTSNR